jgi:mannose-1-phosphate guanylyltransferase / phosphomannomutase
VRAVVMAGGVGTRLRPMTASLPKPLLPVVNRPIMEHALLLLRRHGLSEAVVTVQFLAALVRSYFGDGEDLGMRLTYATEQKPLGTAGSVRNARSALVDDTFLVVSGDALTDVDLTALVAHHRKVGAVVTVCLARVPDPVEFGVVVLGADGRVERFVEKPGWGQVISDTVNTGVYVMEPEVLDWVPEGQAVDWSADVFPHLVAAGAPVHGYVADGYWQDVGTIERYLQAQADVLERRVHADIDGFEVAPGVWIGEGADVDPGAVLVGPLYVGRYSKVEDAVTLRQHTVLGDNVVVRSHAFLHRAVVHDNVYVGPSTNLRGCVVGRGSDVMRAARLEEGAVLGDDCVVGEEAIVGHDVTVYPAKTIEAGAVVRSSVMWESRGHRSLFGPRGVSGIVNVEITPELAVRLAGAFATTLRKGATVVTGRDGSRAARALKRAAISALNAGAIDVRDLEHTPLPVARHATARDADGGIVVRTTPGAPESVDILLLGPDGGDLPGGAQRHVDRLYGRQEARRAFPGEIGELTFPARVIDNYVDDLVEALGVEDLSGSGLRIVVDAGRGSAALVLPRLLGRLGVDAFTLNTGLDEARPAESEEERAVDLARLGEIVASSRAAFGIRFDRVGERLALVDDRGRPVDDERALLVLIDLVAAECRGGTVAVPVSTTRIAEQVTRFHGVDVHWTPTDTHASGLAPDQQWLLAGDGRGGFVIPEAGPSVDGFAAFARLVGLVARTRLTLSEIDARIPRTHVLRADVSTPWAAKGAVMRRVAEAAGTHRVDTTDGLRVVEPDGRWCLVLPHPSGAVTRLWAEGPDDAASRALLDHWVQVVVDAGG